MKHLQAIVEQRDTLAGRLFDYGVQALILLNVVAFSVETLPDIPSGLRRLLETFELVSVLLLRIVVAEHRLRFIFSFFGLIDLIAILPFYLGAGVDLRSMRAWRLLRLFKLFRYTPAIDRFRRAFVIVKDELILFGAAAALVLYLSAVGIYLFENEAQPEAFKSVFHSLWWALATLTTVGYGDVYPVTAGGRLFTFLVLIVGLGIVAVPTGLVASALSKAREEEDASSR